LSRIIGCKLALSVERRIAGGNRRIEGVEKSLVARDDKTPSVVLRAGNKGKNVRDPSQYALPMCNITASFAQPKLTSADVQPHQHQQREANGKHVFFFLVGRPPRNIPLPRG